MPSLDAGYYDEYYLKEIGFRRLGHNVRIAKDCTIVGTDKIAIGDNVRIDSYASILVNGPQAFLELGSNVHIGGGCYLGCNLGIKLDDFSGLSHGVRIFSQSDDYSGQHLTNPTVPSQYAGVSGGPVHLHRHVIVGAGSVILPKVTLGEGAAIGAQSLVTKNLEAWGVYFGIPVKRLKTRSDALLELEKQYKDSQSSI